MSLKIRSFEDAVILDSEEARTSFVLLKSLNHWISDLFESGIHKLNFVDQLFRKREKIWWQSKLRNNLSLICVMRSSSDSHCTVEQMMSQNEVEEHSVSTYEMKSDQVLCNLNFEPVKVKEFEEYVKKAVESRLLESQWEVITRFHKSAIQKNCGI